MAHARDSSARQQCDVVDRYSFRRIHHSTRFVPLISEQGSRGSLPGTKLSLNTDGVFHFGNVPSNETFLTQRRRQLHHFKTRQHHLQFQGCLSDIKINNQATEFDVQSQTNVEPCYEHEESGVFFSGGKEIILGK